VLHGPPVAVVAGAGVVLVAVYGGVLACLGIAPEERALLGAVRARLAVPRQRRSSRCA
jgi:hypothetical protein